MPHTGSLRNTTGVDPRAHIAPIGCLLHFSEHRVTANFVGRGMPSANAWRPGSAGWFDCGNLIRSSVLYEPQCSIKGRLWEGNRRKYAEFEVLRPRPRPYVLECRLFEMLKPWVFDSAPPLAQIVGIIHSMIDAPGLLI